MQMLCMSADTNAMLIMEDLTSTNQRLPPLHVEEKGNIIAPNLAKVVLKALAHFHGVWITWLTKQEPKTLGGMTVDQFKKVFASKYTEKTMSDGTKIHE